MWFTTAASCVLRISPDADPTEPAVDRSIQWRRAQEPFVTPS